MHFDPKVLWPREERSRLKKLKRARTSANAAAGVGAVDNRATGAPERVSIFARGFSSFSASFGPGVDDDRMSVDERETRAREMIRR